jgi:hypothetical protein
MNAAVPSVRQAEALAMGPGHSLRRLICAWGPWSMRDAQNKRPGMARRTCTAAQLIRTVRAVTRDGHGHWHPWIEGLPG